MATYLIGGLIGAVVVYFFTHLNRVHAEPSLNLKSDGKKSPRIKDAPQESPSEPVAKVKRPIRPAKPKSPKVTKKKNSKLPKKIDMSNVTGIRMEGIGNVDVHEDHILVDNYMIVAIKKSTLFIKSPRNTNIINGQIVIGNGNVFSNINTDGDVVISGNNVIMSGNGGVHIQNNMNVTSDDDITNITQIPSVKRVKIPLINFDSTMINRVSNQVTGNIRIFKHTYIEDFNIVMKGTGSIKFNSCAFDEVDASLSGTGKIKINHLCTANQLELSVDGTGSIISQIEKVASVSKTVRGVGSIKCASDKKKVPPWVKRGRDVVKGADEFGEDLIFGLENPDIVRKHTPELDHLFEKVAHGINRDMENLMYELTTVLPDKKIRERFDRESG